MYKRELTEVPDTLIKNGKSLFGSYKTHPSLLDIRDVFRPIGIFPLPTFITNFRIKSRLTFCFNIGDYAGIIDFLDVKIFGFAEVNFWNKTTKQRYSYRSVMGPRRRFVPHELSFPAAVISYKKSRYIKISWDRKHDKLAVVFKLKGDSARPSANGAFIAHLNSSDSLEYCAVTPAPTQRRCSAIYCSSQAIHGSLTLKSSSSQLKMMTNEDGISFFCMNRIYSRYRSYGERLTGIGEVNGKSVVFYIQFTSQEPADSDKFNSNVLFYNDQTIPLPPVTITHNSGIMNKWNIQDTENMVDLSFTPASESMHSLSLAFVRTQYHTILGSFEGVLLTPSGEKIVLHSLQGLAKKYLLRL